MTCKFESNLEGQSGINTITYDEHYENEIIRRDITGNSNITL